MSEENNKEKATKQEKQTKQDTAHALAAETTAPKAAIPETAQSLLEDNISELKVRRAKGSKNITQGICHVLATFNNTMVSITDLEGRVIAWSSAGRCNFKGSRKPTAYAAQAVAQAAGREAMTHGLKELRVRLKGPGMGRDAVVRTLQALGYIILGICDDTPITHNGCRRPKKRRI